LKKHYQHPAVVLGLGAGGLDAVRSLGKHGIEVYGIFTSRKEAGRFSKYCKSVAFPPLKTNPDEFLKRLIDFGKNMQKKAVLLSTNDRYINFMCKHREILFKYFLFLIPDGDFIVKLVNKAYMVQLANKYGLPIPRTFFCDNGDLITQIAEEIHYPCIIKPLNSFSTSFQGKNLIIDDHQSLINTFKNHPEYIGNSLVQEIIGGGDNMLCQFQTYLDAGSQPLAIMTSRKLRQYPPDRGTGSYMVTEELPEVRELSLSFLQSIKYKGIACLEFKMDAKTGKYFFIEINPRIPWGHARCSDCGNSLALAAYSDLTERNMKKDSVPRQINGIRWIDLGKDIPSFVHKFLRREITFRAWAVSVFKANSFAFWDFKDPLPFVYMVWRLFISFIEVFQRFLHTGKIIHSKRKLT
jgi:predicted ATP-grasp superfamily ATP-dependent carboligase